MKTRRKINRCSTKVSKEDIIDLRRKVAVLRKTLKERLPDLRALLRRRGFSIYKSEPSHHLLIPAGKHLDDYYAMLHKYSFRLFLRDVIKHQDHFSLEQVARYASLSVTKGYIAFLLSLKLIRKRQDGYALAKKPVRSFGETLEWYVAEIFSREFGAEAVWGIKFRRPRVGGDYDVIAGLEATLVYAEVKSSPPKQIFESEIDAFLERVEDLAPEIAVFLMDTELRMKDKIVPLFEAALKKRSSNPAPIVRMERELFQISDRIFIINAKQSIVHNIEKVISSYYRNRYRPEVACNIIRQA